MSAEGRSTARSRAREVGLPLVVAVSPALILAVYLEYFGIPLNLFESGTGLSGGLRILSGEMPYVDFFAFYGPLTYLESGIPVAVTGSIATGLWLSSTLSSVLGAAVCYLLTYAVSGRRWWAVSAPVALTLIGAGAGRGLLGLSGILALSLFERTGRKGWLLLCGVLGALALLWIQDAGAWFAVAFLLTLLASHLTRPRGQDQPGGPGSSSEVGSSPPHAIGWRQAGLVVFGGAVVMVVYLIWLATRGALDDWIYWSFVFPLSGYTARDSTGYLGDLISSWRGLPLLQLAYKYAFYVFPYVFAGAAAAICVVAALVRMRGRRGRVPFSTTMLAVFSLLLLRVVLASMDEAKLASAAAPVVICVLGMVGDRVPPPRAQLARVAGSLVALAAVAWLVVWPIQVSVHRQTNAVVPQGVRGSGELAGIRIASAGPPTTTVAELDSLDRAVRRLVAENEPILVLPTSPMVYAITSRENATRHDYLDPVYTTETVDAEIAASISAMAPKVIITAENAFPGTTMTAPELAPRAYAALRAHYSAQTVVGPWTIWTRGRP